MRAPGSIDGHARAAALAAAALTLLLAGPAAARITVNGVELAVFDPHLHFGSYGQMTRKGKEFLAQSIPDFLRLHTPPLISLGTSPWASHVGVRSQLEMAGIDHGILLATYTQRTNGYATNEQLLAALQDSRNHAKDGTPLFWGLVSINVDDFTAPGKSKLRLDALRSYLVKRPKQIIGIKLAHAHQGIAFNDTTCDGIYAVAAEVGAPVLLHTGFSPFPGSKDTDVYYNPIYLKAVVEKYTGAAGGARVDFILAHAGQGDLRSVKDALSMAKTYPNVYLDLSALKRPFLRDENGNDISAADQQTEKYKVQLPYVLARVKELGLVSKALFATDGPQYSGMARSYLTYFVDELKKAGFTVDEMRKILNDNAYGVFINRVPR